MSELIIEEADGILELTLNRPEVKNALSTPLLVQLAAQLRRADALDSIRCVILTGAGNTFCAGADLKEMSMKGVSAMIADKRPGLFAEIGRFTKPIITACNGLAVGAGFELVLHSDIIIADPLAKFGFPEINLGIIPGAGGTQRLTKAIGKARAMEMILTGELLDAPTAYFWGITNETQAQCVQQARIIAEKIAHKAPLAVKAAKQSINQAFETSLSAGIALERANFVSLAGTHDRNEGIAAFLEKRKPTWTGN